MSALLEICPSGVREQMLMRMDEIQEDYGLMRSKIMAYTANKVENSRNGATAMEVDYLEDGGDWGPDEEDGGERYWRSTRGTVLRMRPS